MKVMQAKFGFDEQCKPTLYAKCKMDNLEETKGKFPVTFGIVKDPKNDKKLLLVAIQGDAKTATGKDVLAVAHYLIAIDWLKLVIEQKGYKWVHTYYSDVKKIEYNYDAFMMPFNTEGWNTIPDIPAWEKMLKTLEEAEPKCPKKEVATNAEPV